MQNELQKAVLKTLIYSDIFDFPLRISEIHRYLIGYSCSEEELSKLLYANDTNSGESSRIKIHPWQGYFYLEGKKWIVAQRIKKEKIAKDKLEKAQKLTAILKIIPWIKLVAVTGRVVAFNCEEADDIDLLIVAAPNRLWLSRAGEWLFLSLLGRRRRPYQTQNLKDKLCPNMYLSEENLELPHQDLFTANELARVKVIWERNNTYQKLVEANRWIYKFLPNWKVRLQFSNSKSQNPNLKQISKVFIWNLALGAWNFCFDYLERLSKLGQLKYMQKHQTTEIVKDSLLMFHPRDMREKVLGEFNHRLQKIDL